MLWVGIQYHSAVPLSPERRDFHNRIQAAAQFADKERGLLLPERQDFHNRIQAAAQFAESGLLLPER
jgi:hypothetical protein